MRFNKYQGGISPRVKQFRRTINAWLDAIPALIGGVLEHALTGFAVASGALLAIKVFGF